jgi:hypothetical protein
MPILNPTEWKTNRYHRLRIHHRRCCSSPLLLLANSNSIAIAIASHYRRRRRRRVCGGGTLIILLSTTVSKSVEFPVVSRQFAFGKHFRDFEKCSWYYSTNSYRKTAISRQGGQIAVEKGKLPEATGNSIDLETVVPR